MRRLSLTQNFFSSMASFPGTRCELPTSPGHRSFKSLECSCSALVAQLDRALPSEGKGRTFESSRVHSCGIAPLMMDRWFCDFRSGTMAYVAEDARLMTSTPSPILMLRNVSKSFVQGKSVLQILQKIEFDLYPQELVALTGASGSGKTTLLQIMGLLDLPSEGTVTVGSVGFPVTRKSKAYTHLLQRDAVRRDYLGFVYQYHHLLPELTALENVVLPQLIAGRAKDIAEKNAKGLLKELCLEQRIHHLPSQLSGGEQQRVAIARAVANMPKILLADEPTGNLDDSSAKQVFQLLLELTRHKGIAVVMATHNLELAEQMTRRIHLHSGNI